MIALALAALLASTPATDPLPELRAIERALAGEAPRAGDSARAVLAALPLLWRQGRFEEAAALLAKAPADDRLGPEARWLRAESLAYAGRPGEAAELLGDLARGPVADPIVRRARERLPEELFAAGDAAGAVARWRALLGAPPGSGLRASAPEWEEYGRALLAVGDAGVAARALREAWLCDPADPAGGMAERELEAIGAPLAGAVGGSRRLLVRVRQLLAGGHPDAAHSEAELLSGGPSRGRQELYSGQADRALGRAGEARQHWSRAMLDPNPRVAALATTAYARSLEAEGDWKRAVELLSGVARLRPRSAEALEAGYLAAWMELQHGLVDEALAEFRRIAGIGRAHAAESRWWIGWALFEHGRPAEAAAAWNPIARPVATELGQQATYWIARALADAGSPVEAGRLLAPIRSEAASYYALLADGGRPPPVGAAAVDCADGEAPPPLLARLERAELLWALGEGGLAAAELDAAAAEAGSPRGAAAVVAVESALGEAGRAFALVSAGRAWVRRVPPGRDGPEACGRLTGGELSPELYPRPHRESVERAAAAAGIDPLLLWSVMRQESRFREGARSAARAAGLMQLLGSTRRRIELAAGAAASGPDGEIAAAAWYLRALLDRFGSEALAVAAYDGGPPAVERWRRSFGDRPLDEFVERIPFRETRRYVKRVLANHAAYRALFGRKGSDGPLVDAKARPGRSQSRGVEF